MKQVLLIGDSLRMGYCETVKELLADRAEVVYPAENCRSSTYIRCSLFNWSQLCDSTRTAVVQFGCGQWDTAHFDGDELPLVSLGEYTNNLRAIVRHLREYFPGAHLIFATTTPMNPAGIEMRNPRTTEDIRRYNEAAKSVMAELSVEVNDLFAAAEGWSEDSFIDYCHLKPEAYRALAEIVVRRIAKHL